MSTLDNLLPLLEPEALVRVASPKAMTAGQELFNNRAVTDVVIDGEAVRGKVKGTHAVPHSTTLKRVVAGGGKRIKLECNCSCPTFTDGWEKICHHGVALALELRQQYLSGGDLTMTQNPWVTSVDAKSRNRYQIQQRHGLWQVSVFGSGSAVTAAKRKRKGMAAVDKLINHYLDQAVDETDDGAAMLEDVALAGMLYFAREASVSIKGIGKLIFVTEPLVLRIRAESKKSRVELHAFLEHKASERTFEVDEGRVIAGAPTWFLWPPTAEIFLVPDTPPWTLEAVAKQPRIIMDASVAAEDMDALSESLQSVGVPKRDLFELASDAREVDNFVVTIEGGASKIALTLAARYDNVTLAISGHEPESARYAATIGDESIAFYRDLEAEARARQVLYDGKLRWSDADEAFVALGDTAIEFIVAGLPLLPEAWDKKIPALPKLRSKAPKPSISVRNKGGSVLDVEALVDVEGETELISMRDLLRWLHEGRRWVELADGSVAKLDPKILEPVADAAGAMQFDKQGNAEVSTLELGTLARLLQEVPDAKVAKDVKKLMANMTGERSARAPRKAKALTAKLRDYQKSGYAWLWQLHENQMAGILADDMGLGKTVQALALLTKAKEVDGERPSLIVGPTSVLGVWRQEVKKWAPSLSVLVWHGVDRAENTRLLKKTDVVVTSYAILRRDIDDLAKIRFRYVILDEAQYIKNWTTSTAKSTKKLKAEHRLALSGTPIENHLVDLWAIYDFLAPGFLGKLSEFQKGYVKPIEDGDEKALETLRARIRPFIMRRRKEDVASELPPKTEQTIFVQFGRSQLALYNRILKAAKSEIDSRIGEVGIEKSQMTILAALTRLRQVCTDPRLLNLPEGSAVPKSAKLEAFRDLIAECVGSGRKALVFSQFVEMQKLITETLDELEIEYLWLHGGSTNRDELVQRFQQKSGPPVFLISLKAGGAGLTLTEADTVIHYDPWWNPAVEDQATDRAHRIGQDKPVMVYRLVVEHTVEQKMVELGAEKRKVAESALGRDTKVGKKLTMEDVDKLLETPVGGQAAWDEV
ncbi:DEAD/DEAH box helicase [Pseudenhygromyxa sp. WMMC2535]|uniref:DEAD/DEAH box helicase n=1 Tax=Pseudenhygromyxa sp. WMMC2535 TaxID=2712867 RepID=UPI001551ED51|nr:DEAD/DEAH box helicase [Pseudenhygromyxa sp. WMMC2535]NVB37866.1 DEAD/DEAH box helicase [Pseudenhygromyxa sp. WMMC2535]